jgi:hypothetical protein
MASEAILKSYVKPLPEKDKSAYIHDFFTSIKNLMRALGPTLAEDGMLSFLPHLSDEKFNLLHPGEVRLAPPPFPVKPNILNFQGNMKEFDRVFKFYETELAERKLYDDHILFIISVYLNNLPADDVLCIKAIDTSGGDPKLFLPIIHSYLEDKYGTLAESAQDNLRAIISRPLSYETSLDGNFVSMRAANAILSANNIGLSENQMFREACIKLSKNPRTKPLVEDFKKRDAYNPNTATFSAFCAWAVIQYDVRSPPDGTAAFAFHSDSDYRAVTSPPPPTVTPVKSTDPVAAASVSPAAGQITLTAAEINAIIEARKKAGDNKGKKGKAIAYCILHGHGGHGPGLTLKNGKVAYCNRMSDKSGAPKAGYTLAQVNCSDPNGPPVDGMARSQDVMSGWTKP